MVLIEGDLHRGWSGYGTSNIEFAMHCYIIFLVSTQTVEYPSFFFHANLVFQLEEKEHFQFVCEHCILSLLICEL